MSYTSLMNIGTNNGTDNTSLIYNRLAPIWVYTSSDMFIVPFTGKYRVVCIGKGGDGGNGKINGTMYEAIKGKPACGGGSGGCGIGLFELTENQSINISVTDASSNFDNGKIIANAGGKGDDGIFYYNSTTNGNGGVGGTVSGSAVLINIPGVSGESSTEITIGAYSSRSSKGTSGANLNYYIINPTLYRDRLGVLLTLPVDGTKTYVTGTDGNELTYYTIDAPYGGLTGCGGDGAGIVSCYLSGKQAGGSDGTGGKGGTGCILIEYIGE